MSAIKKAGILFNARIESSVALTHTVQEAFNGFGVSTWICAASQEPEARGHLPGTEVIVSLGGDGTLLRVARLAAGQSIPILAVNMGNIGFNTELDADGVLGHIPALVEGGGWTDERAMLDVELPAHTGFPVTQALNDVVVGRGGVIRAIRVRVSVNNLPITHYRTDGIVVATATGSTAYSLAAGGPVLFPNACELLLTPLLPITGPSAALVLPSDAVVELEVQTAHEARASIDGQVEVPLSSGDVIRVWRSRQVTRLLRVQAKAFFYQNTLKKLSHQGIAS